MGKYCNIVVVSLNLIYFSNVASSLLNFFGLKNCYFIYLLVPYLLYIIIINCFKFTIFYILIGFIIFIVIFLINVSVYNIFMLNSYSSVTDILFEYNGFSIVYNRPLNNKIDLCLYYMAFVSNKDVINYKFFEAFNNKFIDNTSIQDLFNLIDLSYI